MAEKTLVYLRGEDGKPYEAASFSDFGEAQKFARDKQKFGQEALVSQGSASKDKLKSAFPNSVQSPPVNSALDAALANAKAQLIDEQIGEAAKAAVADSGAGEGIAEAAAAREEANTTEAPADDSPAPEPEKASTSKASTSKST